MQEAMCRGKTIRKTKKQKNRRKTKKRNDNKQQQQQHTRLNLGAKGDWCELRSRTRKTKKR
ncbi:hypothetical protein I7I48_03742 [Histoplasma ohiense]|nr:hypothetical protein I7I48_03742 [Histoplasma ohiense (nom. inval.)]